MNRLKNQEDNEYEMFRQSRIKEQYLDGDF